MHIGLIFELGNGTGGAAVGLELTAMYPYLHQWVDLFDTALEG